MVNIYNTKINKDTGVNTNNDKTIKVLSFVLDDKEYGIDINYITTVIENDYSITRVPGTPKFIKGVINLRGDIVPIMELRNKLKLPPVEDTIDTKVIVVDFNEVLLGIKVDKVNEVIEIPKSSFEPLSSISDDENLEYYQGISKVGDKIIILIDIEKIIEI